MSARGRRTALLAGAIACALAIAPAAQAAPTVTCAAGSLAVALDAAPVTIDATGDPVIVNGAAQPCAGLATIQITDPSTAVAVANSVTLLTGRDLTITASLGLGNDTLTASGPRPIGTISGGAGDDNLTAPDADGSILQGDAHDDTLNGRGGSDDLRGGSGSDTLAPGSGNGSNDGGGGGEDTLTYATLIVNVVASLAPIGGGATIDATGANLTQSITNVDNLVGGSGTDAFTGNADDNELDGGPGTATDQLSGLGGADTLTGGDAGDDLDGGPGADTLLGGDGDDVLVGGDGIDTLNGAGGTDTASFRGRSASVTASLQPAGSSDGDTFAGIEQLRGGAGDDFLTGSDAIDRIDGAEGDDTIFGGLGKDVLIGGDSPADQDTLSYENDGAAVVADLRDPVLRADVTDTTSGFENVVGGDAGNTIFGDAFANTILGGDGADTLNGLDGNDSIDGGDLGDTIDGGEGDDAISGAAGADGLSGGAGDDAIDGGADDDTIRPGPGGGATAGAAALVDGGAGSNVLSYADLAGVAADVSLGPPATSTEGTATVAPDVQRVIRFANVTGSAQDDTLRGNSAANVLSGLGGDDTLLGGLGDDVLDGGLHGAAGDTASYETQTNGAVIANLAATPTPEAFIGAERDTLPGIENLTGTASGDQLTGTATRNVLSGLAGSDTISDAGDGGDVLRGGDQPPGGGDTLDYSAAPGAITVNMSADPTPASTDDAAGFENVNGGAGADVIIGDEGPNAFNGNGAGDTLDGRGGNDTLAGQGGDDTLRPGTGAGDNSGGGDLDDTLSYEGLAAAVSADISASPTGSGAATVGAMTQTLAGIEHIVGGTQADVLTGSAAANTLTGGGGGDTLGGLAGIDTLVGQAGDDTLAGGSENDTLLGGGDGDTLVGGPGSDSLQGGSEADVASYEDGRTGAVVATLQAPTPGGGSAPESDTYSDIENLRGGAGNDTLTGSAAVNVIEGGAGSDTIVGVRGPAQDTLRGGENPGDDDTVSYQSESSAIRIDLAATAPDPLLTDVATQFESAIGGSGNDTIAGDGDANRLAGGDGEDALSGAGGADQITGGDDEDTIAGGDGADQITGDDHDDVIDGGAGDDVIDAGDDEDTMTGGPGADVMAGGRGVDRVSFAGATEAVSVSLDGNANDGARPATGPGEGDNVLSTENVTGGPMSDTLVGDQAINTLLGGAGNDVLDGGGNDDVLDGGDDSDTASYAGRAADEPVTATLDGVAPRGGAANEQDSFVSIEGLRGGDGADALSGGSAGDTLAGGPNGDSLVGGDGNDELHGEDGDDAITGGTGADRLLGGPGADRLDGGLGTDAFFGDDGDDDITAFDGAVENVRCGAGTDRAALDLGDTSDLGDCELRRVPSESELPFVPSSVVGARDRDSDGADDTADCNDTDAAIRPGAPEVAANGIDENCDGADASAPRLATTLRSRFTRTKRGLRVRILELRQVPAGASIEVTCSSKRSPRCPFRSRRRTVGAARATLSLRGYFGDRSLSTGTVIEVRVTVAGAIGRSTRLQVVGRGSPKRTLGCLPPGAAKAVSC